MKKYFEESSKIIFNFITNNEDKLIEVVNTVEKALKNNNKILICGNGGSAADSQHFAAELVGRYKMERKGLPSIALTTDTSILTAIGNDYGYDKIFERQVEGLGNKGDILIGISTSGNSENVINAVLKGKEIGLTTIGLLGKDGGKLKDIVDIPIIVSSNNTPRVQECHVVIYHSICEELEKRLFNDNK